MKKAYVVAEVVINDPESYAKEYSQYTLATFEPYNGRVLTRGGLREQLEGEDDQHHSGLRTVIVEFPSMQQARDWYHSEAYTRLREIRQQYSTGRFFIIEGA